MADAERVFNKVPSPEVASWNAMILGYVKCAQGLKALKVFWTNATWCAARLCYFTWVLNACANIGALEEGRCAHEQII
jgi:hypothetical protein